MRKFTLGNKLQGLAQRIDQKELNAIYVGIVLATFNNRYALVTLPLGEATKEFTSSYYILNEYATLDKERFIHTCTRLKESRDNMFKEPKYFSTTSAPDISKFFKVGDYIGNMIKDSDDNSLLTQTAYTIVKELLKETQITNDVKGEPNETDSSVN